MNVRKLLALIVLMGTWLPGSYADDDDDLIRGQCIIQLEANGDIEQFHLRYGTSTISADEARKLYLVRVPDGQDEEEFAELVEDDDQVRLANLNFVSTDINPKGQTQSIFFKSDSRRYFTQPAWRLIRASPAHFFSTGKGVTVAIIDTGVADHRLLRGRIRSDGYNFVDESTDTDDRFDGLDNDGDGGVDEMAGHGTLIAGLLVRVAPRCEILPVRIMDDEGRSSTFDMIRGINFAVERGAEVINISMGTIDPADALREAVESAHAAGAVIIAAAGNDDSESILRYPAAFADSGVVAVAATDESDIRAAFSNYGPYISIAAPGVDLTSTALEGGFGRSSGTSFSAPLVAGVAALVRSTGEGLSREEVCVRVLSAATPIDGQNPGYEGKLGSGRIDALGAVTDRENDPPRGID